MYKNERHVKLLGDVWAEKLYLPMSSDYMKKLSRGLNKARVTQRIHPEQKNIFNAFWYTPFEEVRVVMLGQDPYNNYDHFPSVPDGLAFSSGNNMVFPKSLEIILKKIEKELYNGLDVDLLTVRSLHGWARQGVFLLNSSLTVRHDHPRSHFKYWNKFTRYAVQRLNDRMAPIIWLLWGQDAKAFRPLITNSRHRIIESEHPIASSYASREWDNKDCFIEVAKFMKDEYHEEIDWRDDLPY